MQAKDDSRPEVTNGPLRAYATPGDMGRLLGRAADTGILKYDFGSLASIVARVQPLGGIAMPAPQTEFTSLLSAVGNGDAAAAEQLWRTVYDELHRVAQVRMAREGQRGHLQTTVLVQEAYLRLMGSDAAAIPSNRRHFFAAAANAMRQFLVDDARKRGRLKRGSGRRPGELSETAAAIDYDPVEVLALDEALAKLREHDAAKAEIAQLRYFTGLTVDETAEVLGISPRQVDKEWRFAKTWLHRELS